MPIKFKDYLTVDYAPGEPEQTKVNAKKRKKDAGEATNEALSLVQRQKRARQMKKYKSKIKIGREKAARRTADPKRLRKRARKQARNMLAKKLAKANYADLSFSRKQEIEKRLEKLGPRIDRIAKKLLPKMRKIEMERKRGNKSARVDRSTAKND